MLLFTKIWRKKRIAVLICKKCESVPTSIDNEGLKPAFEKVGLTYEPIIWDEEYINWQSYDAVLIRATWDYIAKYDKFMHVISLIKKLDIPLINPLETVRWNSKKTYLLELANKGILIFDTLILNRVHTPVVGKILTSLPRGKYVIKPAISGGADRTFATDSHTIQYMYEIQYGSDEDVIIQPMAPEIISEGEWELVFFNGDFSHAVLATPKKGDFRVQRKHVGSVQAKQPPQDMIKEAQHILNLTPGGIPCI